MMTSLIIEYLFFFSAFSTIMNRKITSQVTVMSEKQEVLEKLNAEKRLARTAKKASIVRNGRERFRINGFVIRVIRLKEIVLML